jgi:hypothetical protein
VWTFVIRSTHSSTTVAGTTLADNQAFGAFGVLHRYCVGTTFSRALGAGLWKRIRPDEVREDTLGVAAEEAAVLAKEVREGRLGVAAEEEQALVEDPDIETPTAENSQTRIVEGEAVT